MKSEFDLNDENKNRVEDTKPNPVHTNEPEAQDITRNNQGESYSPSKLYALETSAVDDLRSRWSSVQAQFVDQPCTSIEQADALVTDALERIHQKLTHHQEVLRNRWYDHADVSTEDLRITLQDYRSLLNNLLDQ